MKACPLSPANTMQGRLAEKPKLAITPAESSLLIEMSMSGQALQ